MDHDTSQPQENEAIYRILMKIQNRWRAAFDEDSKETVIISQDDVSAEVKKENQEVIPETVVISPPGTIQDRPLPAEQESGQTLSDKKEGLSKSRNERNDDNIPDTVIITPQGNRKFRNQEHANTPGLHSRPTSPEDEATLQLKKKKAGKAEEEDFLTETIILKPKKSRAEDEDGAADE